MNAIWNSIFDVSPYSTITQRHRARIVEIFGLLAVPIALLRIFAIEIDIEGVVLFATLILIGGGIASYFLARRGSLVRAQWLLIVSLMTTLSLIILNNFTGASDMPLVMGLAIAMSGLLLQERGMIVTAVWSLVILVIATLAQGDLTTDFITGLMSVTSYTVLTYLWVQYARVSQQAGYSEEVEARFKLADITTQIVRSITTKQTMQEALTTALELIVKAYDDYYHAQVFLLQPDEVTTSLVASTGDVGKRLLARNHSLAAGSVSIVGQTMLHARPQFSYVDEVNSILRPNDLLPQTVLELGIPLRVGDELIGMLDLQSKKHVVIKDRDLAIFQSLADNLALAINNWQQLETVQEQIEEKELLAEQTRSALREVERLNKRIIGRAWSEYLDQARDVQGLDYDAETEATLPASSWTVSLAEAAQNNTIVHNENTIAVPLLVRGQVIGAMEFEIAGDYSITPEDLELIQEIGQGFGLAAENVRLLEDSQRGAQRQTVINEIGTRLQGKTNVEAILAETAHSLYEAMRAKRVTVRLGTPDNADTPSAVQPEVAQ